MTKAKSKSKSKAKGATRTTSRPPSKHQSSSQSADHSPVRTAGESKLRVRPVPATSAPRADTKHAHIIAMLRCPQVHDRGNDDRDRLAAAFGARLSGRYRSQELGLDLVSEPSDTGRVYRIKEGKASSTAAERVKRAAARATSQWPRHEPY